MEPRDLDLTSLPQAINPRGKLGISSWHPGKANVSMVDGIINVLNRETTPQELQSRLTIAAGD